jgi:ATP-dependent Lhr-like helicase
MLRRELPGDAVFWMNAADPASLCGAGLETAEVISENAGTVQEEGVQPERDSWQCHAVWNLPRRMSGTHLVFHGPELVLVSRRRGEELEFRVGPDHPGLQRYFTLFDHLTGRALRPVHSVKVFTINGAPALLSPYAEPLIEYGFTKGYRELIMRGGYR